MCIDNVLIIAVNRARPRCLRERDDVELTEGTHQWFFRLSRSLPEVSSGRARFSAPEISTSEEDRHGRDQSVGLLLRSR